MDNFQKLFSNKLFSVMNFIKGFLVKKMRLWGLKTVSSQKLLFLKSHSFIQTRHFQYSAYKISDFC